MIKKEFYYLENEKEKEFERPKAEGVGNEIFGSDGYVGGTINIKRSSYIDSRFDEKEVTRPYNKHNLY